MNSITDLDFKVLRKGPFFPSPSAWEDEVLYFLMLDRFSDGKETGYIGNDGDLVPGGTTPPAKPSDHDNAIHSAAAAAHWRDAGGRFCGGNLAGLASKLGYLKRLGITALWVSPVFKQMPSDQGSYHGYGIQDFLDVDPHFGTRDDLRDLVKQAHDMGIRVILDIIFNHAGDVFGYQEPAFPNWSGPTYPTTGFRDGEGKARTAPLQPMAADATPEDGGVWPRELQNAATFTRKGRINNWDHYPEYVEGDFESLKDISLGSGPIDHYQPSSALINLIEIHKYWIAFADLDGFRIDTVKHMDRGAVRFFAASIHEFGQSIGKDRFALIGEITGGRKNAFETLDATGLSAALGVDDIPDKLEYLTKGYREPSDFFDLFRNSFEIGKDSHTWFRDKVVTLFDDHDQVRKGQQKARFCAGDPAFSTQVAAAVGLSAATLGIPLIYYGTEQGFDGEGGGDRYIRESMFGGDFGAFRSKGVHFFDETNPIYQSIAGMLAIRHEHLALARGRQFLRPISGNGVDFGLPSKLGGDEIRSIVPWSRIFDRWEVLCAINTDPHAERGAWTVLERSFHGTGDKFHCRFSTAGADAAGQPLEVQMCGQKGEIAAVFLKVPPGGFVIYSK